MTTRRIIPVAVLVLSGCRAITDEPDPIDAPGLTLKRLFSGEFGEEGFGPARWLEGKGLATLERAASGGGHDLVSYDPASGERSMLISARSLTPKGESRPLQLSNYEFSTDGGKLLVFTNTRRVWRYHTRGDYWVLDRKSGVLQRLGRTLDSTWLQFAKFNSDATKVAYVHRSDIYVEDLASRAITRLTSDGSASRINGTFDWVYEEEWGLRDGFRWSPDGKSIAFWQMDASGVGEFILVDNTSSLYPKVTPIRYPKVGTTNPSARVGIVASTGGDIRWMDVPGDSRDNYIARMEWAANSDEIVIQRLNRLQNTNHLMLFDVKTGDGKTVWTDRDETWVETCDDFRWFGGGSGFLWVSERDGWRRIFVVSRNGVNARLVTKGEFDVISIEHIDEKGGWIYYLASPDNPTQRFLYRSRLFEQKPPERLTKSRKGTHRYQISPDGKWAIHTGSSFGSPPVVDIIRLPGHEVVRNLVDNRKLREKLGAESLGKYEFFRVSIRDGVEMDGWVIYPPDFDAEKKYPLLIHVYGEPAGQTVLDRYGVAHYMWHQMMAQRGYVIVSMDNRGTPAPRGRAWRKSIYRKIGIIAPKDQAAGLRKLQEKWPFLDKDRVGIWGWSGGGSMTLNALFRYPSLYHAGVAIAFVANQRLYDTIYQERYMGLPDDNAEGFRDGSPITRAKNLEGDLLIVYGTGDDNCHYQNCEMLVNELVRHDKQFEMMAYPNRTHSISQGKNTRKHLFTRMTNFITEHVAPGPR